MRTEMPTIRGNLLGLLARRTRGSTHGGRSCGYFIRQGKFNGKWSSDLPTLTRRCLNARRVCSGELVPARMFRATSLGSLETITPESRSGRILETHKPQFLYLEKTANDTDPNDVHIHEENPFANILAAVRGPAESNSGFSPYPTPLIPPPRNVPMCSDCSTGSVMTFYKPCPGTAIDITIDNQS